MVKPEFGCLGITDNCMLRCKMCNKWKPDIFIKKKDLNSSPTIEQYKKFLIELKELVDDKFVLNFGGGEALLHPDIFEVMKISSEIGFHINLVSNGFLIDENVARKLGNAGLQHIKISLDSIDPKMHDYMRGVDGVHEKALNAIDNLHRFAPNIEIGIISVIYEQTYRDLIPLLDWINSNDKIAHVLVMVAMQPNNTPPEENWWNSKHGHLWPKDKDALSKLMDKLISLKEKNYKINNSIGQLKAAKEYLRQPDKFVKKTTCNMDKAVHISAIGQIFICFNFGFLGDICKGDDIRQIWQSQEAEQVRQKIKNCKKNCHFLINCFFEEDAAVNSL